MPQWSSMWFFIKTCLLRGFVWETMLLAGEAGVHSVNRHAQCFPITNRNKQDIYTKRPRKKKFLRTFGDQSYAKPSISGVLKSLVILGFLPQPHYNITKHNTNFPTCTNYWRTKQRVIEGLTLECFLPMANHHGNLKKPHTIRRNKGYSGLFRPQQWL